MIMGRFQGDWRVVTVFRKSDSPQGGVKVLERYVCGWRDIIVIWRYKGDRGGMTVVRRVYKALIIYTQFSKE